MVNSDVESDSALLAIAMGVFSEEEGHKVKRGQSKTKRNAKSNTKNSKGKQSMKPKKGKTGMRGDTRVVSPTMKETLVNQIGGTKTNEQGVSQNETIDGGKLSPMPGCSRFGYNGDSSPTRHPLSNNRRGGTHNDTESGFSHTNRAIGQGDSTFHPHKINTHDTRTGFSRDCGGAQNRSDRFNEERPSRARESGDDDDGGPQRRIGATRDGGYRASAAADAFPPSGGDSADEVRRVGRQEIGAQCGALDGVRSQNVLYADGDKRMQDAKMMSILEILLEDKIARDNQAEASGVSDLGNVNDKVRYSKKNESLPTKKTSCLVNPSDPEYDSCSYAAPRPVRRAGPANNTGKAWVRFDEKMGDTVDSSSDEDVSDRVPRRPYRREPEREERTGLRQRQPARSSSEESDRAIPRSRSCDTSTHVQKRRDRESPRRQRQVTQTSTPRVVTGKTIRRYNVVADFCRTI